MYQIDKFITQASGSQDRSQATPAPGLRLYCATTSRPGIGRHTADQPNERSASPALWRIGEWMPRDTARLTEGDGIFLELREVHGRLPTHGHPSLRQLRAAAMAGWLATIRIKGRRYTTVEAVGEAFGPPAHGPDDAPSSGGPTQPVPRTSERSAFADMPASRPVQARRT